MKPLNYASLEASKQLVDAGIVLETDLYHKKIAWLDGTVGYGLTNYINDPDIICPAPCFTEVWRELPEYTGLDKFEGKNDAELTMKNSSGIIVFHKARNTNPTDALIDLLIWLRKEEADEG